MSTNRCPSTAPRESELVPKNHYRPRRRPAQGEKRYKLTLLSPLVCCIYKFPVQRSQAVFSFFFDIFPTVISSKLFYHLFWSVCVWFFFSRLFIFSFFFFCFPVFERFRVLRGKKNGVIKEIRSVGRFGLGKTSTEFCGGRKCIIIFYHYHFDGLQAKRGKLRRRVCECSQCWCHNLW